MFLMTPNHFISLTIAILGYKKSIYYILTPNNLIIILFTSGCNTSFSLKCLFVSLLFVFQLTNQWNANKNEENSYFYYGNPKKTCGSPSNVINWSN